MPVDTAKITEIAASLKKGAATPVAPTPAPAKVDVPFAGTKLGVAMNTVLGIPKAAYDATKFVTDKVVDRGVDVLTKPRQPLTKFVDGKLVQNPEGMKEAEDLALGFVGAEAPKVANKAISFLKKEANPQAIKGFLSKLGFIEDDVIKAEKLATAKSSREVRDILGESLERIKATPKQIDDFINEFKTTPPSGLQKLVQTLTGKKVERKPIEPPPFKVPPANSASPVDSAINKLVQAIYRAQPIRAGIAEAQTAERARRIAEVAPLFREGGGEEAFNKALGKLKGQLTDKKGFTPVRDSLEVDEIKALFNKVQENEVLDTFEKVSTQGGLRELLEGGIPQPKQLENLEEVFGHDIIKAIQSQDSAAKKVYLNVLEGLGIARSLMTAWDMSAPLRQGIILGISHPKSAAKSFGEMFRQVFSEKNFIKWLEDVKKMPEYQLMRKSGLYIADPRNLAGGLSAREEAFMSRLIGKIPGMKASQRAYLAYLNKLRVDTFLNLSKTFQEQGVGKLSDMEALAGFINTATGRGDLGKLGRIATELNATFFSPRLIASRLTLLNPFYYKKLPPPVRKEAIKSMVKFIGAGTTVLTLASLAGAKVETNPISSDFGKMRVGNTRWDIWGGFQQWARVFSQLVSGYRKTGDGKIQKLSKKEFPFDSRFDVAENFALGKLAPIPALVVEMLNGQQMMGGDLTLKDAALQNTLPLYVQDFREAYDELGLAAIPATGVPAFFGVGVQTYGGDKKKSGRGTTSVGSKKTNKTTRGTTSL